MLQRVHAEQLAGRSRVIVEFKASPDVRAITTRRGAPGPAPLRASGSRSRRSTTPQLAALAGDPRVARVLIDRPVFATLSRTGAAIGAAHRRDSSSTSDRPRRWRRGRSTPGFTRWHDDLYLSTALARTADAVAHFKDFTQDTSAGGTDQPSDELRARHARRRHHRRLGLRLRRRTHRHRSGRASDRSQSARRRGTRLHQRRHRRTRLRGGEQGRVQHPRHQPLGRLRRVRVATSTIRWRRPRKPRRRRRHRRRRGSGQSRHERARARRSSAASRRRATRRGCMTVGASAIRARLGRSDDIDRQLQLTGPTTASTSRRKARPGRAGSRHRVAQRIRTARSTHRIDAITCSNGTHDVGYQAVSEPERHQHGGADRDRHRGADARSQSGADAERRQGHPAVHRAGHATESHHSPRAPAW